MSTSNPGTVRLQTKVVNALFGVVGLAMLAGGVFGLQKLGFASRSLSAIFALGLLLVGGMVGGRVVSIIGMPRLTGYLIVGVLAGPSGFALFSPHEVHDLELINTLALALIALQAGAELTMPMLRRSFKSLAAASLGHCVVITLGMAALFVGISPFVPFLADLSFNIRIALGVLWGAMAVSKAPADTLAILSETRAKGPLAEHALGVVVLLDVLVLILFAGAMMYAKAEVDPNAHFSLMAFVHLGEELFASVAAGTTLGLVIAFYFWAVGKERLLFTVVMSYVVTAFCIFFHYDTLLVFVVAGFVVMNLTKKGHELIETTESAGSAVMVVFFATAGAGLDLSILVRMWPIALTLAFGRIFFTFLGCRLGHRLAQDPDAVRKYAFTSFISQAGVTIGLAQIAQAQLGDLGGHLKGLVIAVIGINELVGPLMFKIGLARSGEVGMADLHTAEADEPHDDGDEEPSADDALHDENDDGSEDATEGGEGREGGSGSGDDTDAQPPTSRS